jgi:hypothetical protein
MNLTAQFSNGNLRLQKVLGGNPTHRNNDLGPDVFDLSDQKGFTRQGFLRGRIAIFGRSALEYIGDEYIFAFKTQGPDHFIQKLSGPANERLSSEIFLFTGGFANEKPVRMGIAHAKDRLSARRMKSTPHTARDFRLESGPIGRLASARFGHRRKHCVRSAFSPDVLLNPHHFKIGIA